MTNIFDSQPPTDYDDEDNLSCVGLDMPHNEQQPLIDRLEGASDPFGDFAQGDDYDDDWIDE